MDPEILAGIIVFSTFAVFYGFEWLTGRLHASPRPKRDMLFTAVGIFSQTFIAGAVIGSLAGYLVSQLWPQQAGSHATSYFLVR